MDMYRNIVNQLKVAGQNKWSRPKNGKNLRFKKNIIYLSLKFSSNQTDLRGNLTLQIAH